MSTADDDDRYAGMLRAALTDRLVAQGSLHDERVVAAFRTVPRHEFVPLVPLEVAYTDDVVLMKRDSAGVAISSVSQPAVVAVMLEQADIQPGHRVLEIGSGGYNAALLSELVGAGGAVTTIDIDADVVDRARHGLSVAGYDDVQVVQADGEFGWPESAPYDRILVTVTAWDIASAWMDQLAEHGRIVVPLRLRSQTRSIALDRMDDGSLRSRSMALCGFVCMQGAGANHERLVLTHEDQVSLRFDTDQEVVEPPDGILKLPSVAVWSGVLVNREEPLSDLNLWLAASRPGYCLLAAERSAVKKGLVSAIPSWGTSATLADGTLTYLTSRRTAANEFVELGAVAHGPAAAEHAERLVSEIRQWNHDYRQGPEPVLHVHPADTPSTNLPPGFHLTKPHTHLTFTWDRTSS
jgi:protein-L-isoaspartate(D-aspartate) O-methyltransferase